jgi:glycosyltransferase involved in cell wall biosynthesis
VTPPARVKILDVINTAASAKEILLYRVEAANRYPHFENWIVCGPGPHVEVLRAHGIPVEVIDSPRGISLRHVSPVSAMLAFLRLVRFIRRRGFSIVHTHGTVQGVIGRLAAWLARAPVVVHVEHGQIFHEHQRPLERRLYEAIDRFMALFTDHLLFENTYEQRYAIQHGLTGKAKIHFVGSGINLKDFDGRRSRVDEHLAGGKCLIVNVARMDPIKNQIMLLRAIDLLRRTHAAFELWILGDGICRPELEQFVAGRGLQEHVRFFGYRDDVPHLLSQADIGVLTSIKEGIPRGVMEPMAMCLPVVATGVKGNRDVVLDGKTGFLVPLDDDVALAGKLALLMENRDLRLRMGEASRQRIQEHFDERDMIRRILDVYLDLYPIPEKEPSIPLAP